MKKIVLIYLMFSSTFCFSQRTIGISQCDPVDLESIEIYSNTSCDVFFNSTISEFVTCFGQPSNSQAYIYEMIEKAGTKYIYGGDSFYFLDQRLISVEWVSSSWHLMVNDVIVKVGLNISNVEGVCSNINRYKVDNTVRIPFTKGGNIQDGSYLMLELNSSDIITSISVFTNY